MSFCFLRDTFVLCLLNGGSSFVAGFAIFSVLGFMSYEQGLPISEVAATGKSTVSCEIKTVADKICTQVISFYV